MIEIRPLDTCSFQTVVEIWNRGFQGYAVDLTQTLDSLLTRIISHGISISDSQVASFDGVAVGFLLNGLRMSDDARLAWNGGTAVVPEMRGKGVGKKLVEAAIDFYAKAPVNRAMLEAISNNQSAIKLYSRCGYEVVDELTFLQHDEVVHEWQTTSSSQSYTAVSVPPVVTGKLSFYYALSPWQAHWESVALACGEGMLVHDTSGEPVGYALLKKKFSREGNIESISLFQCEVAPGRRDESEIARFTLQKAFAGELGKLKRTTYNLRKSNRVVVDALHHAGFTTFIEQVHMMRTF